MMATEIVELIKTKFADAVVTATAEGLHPHVQVKPESLPRVCEALKRDAKLQLDLLRCISAVDWPAKNAIEVSYDLISTRHGHAFAVKVLLDRAAAKVPTVSGVWPAANWHEREAYDLMGVEFTGHPDLTRILMPEDWTGHPLRKDYQGPGEYHGLKVK